MFKSVPAFMPLLLQALLGWSGMQFLELEINPEYFMRRRELADAADATAAKPTRSFSLRRSGSGTGMASSSKLLEKFFSSESSEEKQAKADRARQQVSVREQCLHAYHIPATKHVLAIVTTTLRYILFLNMSLVGKREPITAAEWVYILLLLSPLFEEIGQARGSAPNPNP